MMLKLKAIIKQLKHDDYSEIEVQLQRNKADNFLFLLNAYKEDALSDKEIIEALKSNANSFYVLKSRLYDKVQNYLVESTEGRKSEILRQLSELNTYCYNTPRETAVAVLSQLEHDLIVYDLATELTTVYSALKRIHVHSPKYDYYVQLYDKHVAYTQVLEKAEELFYEFNKLLSEYYFSRADETRDLLLMIKKEIHHLCQQNVSNRLYLIRNIIIVELSLFGFLEDKDDHALEDVLNETELIIRKFPNDWQFRDYFLILEFLRFEYYVKIGQYKKAMVYFQKVNEHLDYWLLFSNHCMAFHFLVSKIKLYSQQGMESMLDEENQEVHPNVDVEDVCTLTILKMYKAISRLYAGKYREVSSMLNELLNQTSFKDRLHVEIEIKLTLAYVYVVLTEYEMAGNLLRSLYRKIKAQEAYAYENALLFSRALILMMNHNGTKTTEAKLAKILQMYAAINTGEHKILDFLETELQRGPQALNARAGAAM